MFMRVVFRIVSHHHWWSGWALFARLTTPCHLFPSLLFPSLLGIHLGAGITKAPAPRGDWSFSLKNSQKFLRRVDGAEPQL
jgi:hypothetical protein